MSTLFHNQCYIDENESTFLAWEAIQGDEPFSVYHEMSSLLKTIMVLINVLMNLTIKRTFEKKLI